MIILGHCWKAWDGNERRRVGHKLMNDQNFGENTGPALVNYAAVKVPLNFSKGLLKNQAKAFNNNNA
jgi:hypothetical protein